MPSQAEELGFLEIRQQSLKLRELTKVTDEEILQIYNMDFISNLKIWIKTALQDKKGLLLQAIQNLLINMIKVTNDLKYHPYHLQLFDLLTQVSNGSCIPLKYIVYIFSQENWFYFNKVSGTKDHPFPSNPIFYESRPFSLTSTKEQIIRQTLDCLTNYLQMDSLSKNLSFPELILPIKLILLNFKKNCEN
jgi:hypothetical protein